jgi:non-heme chloroperoxidase
MPEKKYLFNEHFQNAFASGDIRGKLFPHVLTLPDDQKISLITNFKWEDKDPKKPLVIFQNGLVCDLMHYRYLAPFLVQNGYDVLLYFYRQHIPSYGPKNLQSIHFFQLAKDIDFIIQQLPGKNLKLKKRKTNFPIIAVGHSMGVNVTLQAAIDFPHHFQSLVLISGSAVAPEEVMYNSSLTTYVRNFLNQAYQKYPKSSQFIWKHVHKLFLARLHVRISGFNPQQVDDQYVLEYLEGAGNLGLELFLQLFKEMNTHSLYNKIPSLSVPTLVLAGEKDLIIPPRWQKELAALIPNSHFSMIQQGSHVPQVDFPDAVNQGVLDFLKSKSL